MCLCLCIFLDVADTLPGSYPNRKFMVCMDETSYVEISGYKIIRKDDPSNIRKHGVAIYIRNNLKFVEITCDIKNVLIVKLLEQDIYIVILYRPPSYSLEENQSLSNFLQEFCNSKEVLLLGDFNLSTLRWSEEDLMTSYIQPTDRHFLDAFMDLGLSQMVMEPTNFPSGNIIDLCLLSHPERLGSVAVKPPLPSCTHGLIKMQYTFQGIFPEPCTFARRVWTKGN